MATPGAPKTADWECSATIRRHPSDSFIGSLPTLLRSTRLGPLMEYQRWQAAPAEFLLMHAERWQFVAAPRFDSRWKWEPHDASSPLVELICGTAAGREVARAAAPRESQAPNCSPLSRHFRNKRAEIERLRGDSFGCFLNQHSKIPKPGIPALSPRHRGSQPPGPVEHEHIHAACVRLTSLSAKPLSGAGPTGPANRIEFRCRSIGALLN